MIGKIVKKYVSIILMLLSLNSYSASWEQVSSIWELDTSSIHKSYNGNVKFWVKEVYTKDKISNLKKIHQKHKIKKDYSKYSYTLSMYELNCSERKIGISSNISYDKSNEIIERFEIEFPDMESIVPNSEGENIVQYVCKKS